MKRNPMTTGNGIALGVVIGTALGAAFGHMGVWLAIGTGVGAANPALDGFVSSSCEASAKQTGSSKNEIC